MIRTRINNSNQTLFVELDSNAPGNVFLVDPQSNYLKSVGSKGNYLIIFYVGWYGNHLAFVKRICDDIIVQHPNVNFGFRLANDDRELKGELGVNYKGRMGKPAVIAFANANQVFYDESFLSVEEINKIIEEKLK